MPGPVGPEPLVRPRARGTVSRLVALTVTLTQSLTRAPGAWQAKR